MWPGTCGLGCFLQVAMVSPDVGPSIRQPAARRKGARAGGQWAGRAGTLACIHWRKPLASVTQGPCGLGPRRWGRHAPFTFNLSNTIDRSTVLNFRASTGVPARQSRRVKTGTPTCPGMTWS